MLITAVRASWLRAPIPAVARTSPTSQERCVQRASSRSRPPSATSATRPSSPDPRGAGAALGRREATSPRSGTLRRRRARALVGARRGLPDHRPAGITLSAISGTTSPSGTCSASRWGVGGCSAAGIASASPPMQRRLTPSAASARSSPRRRARPRAVKLRVGLQDKSVSDSAARVREVRETLGRTSASWWTPTGCGACARPSAARGESDDLAGSRSRLAGQPRGPGARCAGSRYREREGSAAGFVPRDDRRAGGNRRAIAAGSPRRSASARWPRRAGSRWRRICGARPFSSRPAAARDRHAVRHAGISRGHNPLLSDLVEEQVELEDGYVLRPRGPGSG